jgi:heterodisulfide reductase subunit C
MTTKISSEFAAKLKKEKGFNASACFHCGTCAALCPLGYEILPRKIFREVMLGLEDTLRDNLTQIFSCLLCRMCEENCPQGVHIAENMRTLRHLVNVREFGLK